MRKVKLQVTPITDATFERQGWSKHLSNDYNGIGDFFENREDVDSEEEVEEPYFWTCGGEAAFDDYDRECIVTIVTLTCLSCC